MWFVNPLQVSMWKEVKWECAGLVLRLGRWS